MGILAEKIYTGLVTAKDREDQEHNRKRRTAHSLTASIITACRRANWYNFKRVSADKEYSTDPVLLSKFWDGTVEHALLSELFDRVEVKVIDREFGKVCKGIYARVDYLIELEGVQYDLEFKTCDESTFSTFCKYGIQAFPGYYAQCQVMLGAKPFRPLIFAMKCKGTSEYEDEEVERNPGYIGNLVRIKDEFNVSLKGSTPPEREFGYNSGMCTGCEHKFKCWFSHLRSEILTEGNLTENETLTVNKFFLELRQHLEGYNNYIKFEEGLKDYIAFLHTKHAVSKVKLNGITSSAVTTNREHCNTNYVKSILSEEQLNLAFTVGKSEFFRTIYHLEG